MAGVTGLEPATSGVTGQRSNHLSYTPVKGGRRYRAGPWAVKDGHLCFFGFLHAFATNPFESPIRS